MSAPADAITVRLAGGLGNQLFQYGAGRSAAARSSCPLFVDARGLGTAVLGDTPRDYALDWLVDANQVLLGDSPSSSSHWRARVTARMPRALRRGVFTESGFSYDAGIEQVRVGTTLIGYFQSWRYLEPIAETMRAEILESAPRSAWLESTAAELDARAPWTAVHVRRGDYLRPHNADYHGLLGGRYYTAALEQVHAAGSQLVVFSDDPDDALGMLGALSDDAIAIRPPAEVRAIESIVLMSRANALVTANSSFSWWAAWLATGIPVASPTPWLAGAGLDERDLRPPAWLQVPAGFDTR